MYDHKTTYILVDVPQEQVPLQPTGRRVVDSLQLGMAEALADDQRRKQVNDAKLRAVSQRVDYDDFCKMVAGAHLRPVKPCSQQSAAISKPFEGFVMPRYRERRADGGGPSTTVSTAIMEPFTPPDSANDFMRTWRRRCRTPPLRLQYLRTIDPTLLPLIFRVEMDSAVFEGIVEALHAGLGDSTADTRPLDPGWVTCFLHNMMRINGVSMTLALAGKGDI